MKKSIKIIIGILLLGFTLWRCSTPHSNVTAVQRHVLPQNVYASCTVNQDTFNTWFASGKAAQNGLVTAANSVKFPHNNNCDFYQWSERMFLWITSPVSNKGKIVLETPVFYDVAADSAHQRKLVPHLSNTPLRMSSHIEKSGPNGLPVIKDKTGKLFEIENAEPVANIPALVSNAVGSSVAVASVKVDAKGTYSFMDKSGNPIAHPKAIIQNALRGQNIVQQFRAGNTLVFLDANGNVIQSEAGQATGDVLMSQNGSLVYYLTMVNDVYAYFLTASKEGKMSNQQFPTTAAARDSICAFARSKGVTLPDSNALAMEFKSSWVEASSLPDSADYITVKATIPTYNTSDSTKWIPNGEKTVTMALVGIHIVGSVAGHPEMVWATFEHQSNAPNAGYDYLNSKLLPQSVPQDTGKGWLFSGNAADRAFNVSHMIDTSTNGSASDTIFATNHHIISASNTLMIFPWGSAKGQSPNPEDKITAAANSEIISINNSIRKFLPGNDIRNNYLLIGATWTSHGTAPNGYSYSLRHPQPGAAIGTSVLANSTMETYFQADSNSCFTCHSAGNVSPSLNPKKLSHIFAKLQPLINTYNLKQKSKEKLK
jgi:hypothetical protein